jgi:hypothetical protein
MELHPPALDPICYKPAFPPKLRPSPLGATALTCSLLLPAMIAIARISHWLQNAHLLREQTFQRWLAAWQIFCVLTYLLWAVGLILGGLALVQPARRRTCAAIACGVNAIILVGWAFWMMH